MPLLTTAGSTSIPSAEDDERAKVWARLPPEIRRDPKVRAKFQGLGDVVAAVAKPIARAIGIKSCATCGDRQKALNARFPFRRGTP